MTKTQVENPTRPLPAVQRLLSAGLLVAGLSLAPGAQAALSFAFDFSGNTAGLGFLDPVTGAARQAALATAAQAYSNMFGTYFNTPNTTIVIRATSSDNSSINTLMSAGSQYWGPDAGFGNAEVVRRKATTGVDINGGLYDGSVDVNWGYSWDTSGSTNTPGGSFDFYAALFHEFSHAMGFASGFHTNPNDSANFGKDFWGHGKPTADGGDGVAGSFAGYDQFLTNCAGSSFVNAATNLSNPGVIAAAAEQNVCFNGANAKIAYGGNEVDLFAPSSYIGGSSVSHLNTNNATFGTSMMKHDRGTGPEAQVFNAVEVGIFADIGYSLTAAGRAFVDAGLNGMNNNNVPEPGSLALLMAALAAGTAVRRKKKVS